MSKYRLIKLGLAAVMLASTSAASEGADADAAGGPAYRPFYNWTGFYAGAHAGVGWFDVNGGGSSGLIGGGQVGYNYQINNKWVFGLEGELSGTTIGSSASGCVDVTCVNAEAGLDWVATLAPRVGYTFDRWLVYGKVGGAWAHASGTVGINGTQVFSTGETVSGLMLGIGAEYALWNNWTAKFEYNVMDFGNSDNKFNVLKAGINYRFGGPGGGF